MSTGLDKDLVTGILHQMQNYFVSLSNRLLQYCTLDNIELYIFFQKSLSEVLSHKIA